MAVVYKAQDLELERTVAIKVLRPEYDGEAFRREARAAARLPHPNIVTVYDVGHDDNIHYIVMEYVEGSDLKELIHTQAPLRVGRALDIAIQVCAAVGFAHERGIIHCDVKPQNVLVLPDGQVKVTDFGIARAFTPQEREGKRWGTPHYAAPEMVSGRPLTPATDVYAIGILLYEMLTGVLPFDDTDPTQVARRHLSEQPPPLWQHNPRVPERIQRILDVALSKEPTERYQTAAEFGEVLEAYRQHSRAITRPLAMVTPPPASSQQAATQLLTVPAGTEVKTPQKGFDWIMLILSVMAFLAVGGLFPLWGVVIGRAMIRPTPMPPATSLPTSLPVATPTPSGGDTTPIPTPTPTPALVAVPELTGRELPEARRLAQEKELVVNVQKQQHDRQIPPAHVISQSPPPGELVPKGTTIGVVVSLGPEMVIVPNVVGFPVAVKQLDLQDLGLTVVITETWSSEPVGLIITQTPPAGSEVVAGSTVTLTVSSGPRDEVQANLGDKVMLISCELNGSDFHPGDIVQVTLTWQVIARFAQSYTVFIHITDRDGHIITQRDAPPLGGSRPTNTWKPGEKLLDLYTLTLPAKTPPGDYWVRVGMYRGDTRLPVVDPGLVEAEDNALIVRQIQVTNR